MAEQPKINNIIETQAKLEDMECELDNMNKWLIDTYESARRVGVLQQSVNETLTFVNQTMKGINNED